MVPKRAFALGGVSVLVLAATILAAPAAYSNPKASGRAGLTAVNADPVDTALAYVRDHREKWGLSSADVADVTVTDFYRDEHNGVTHVYLLQRRDGLDIRNATMTVNVGSGGKVISANSRFVPGVGASTQSVRPTRSAAASAESAARELGYQPTEDIEPLARARGRERRVMLSDGGVSRRPIPAKLVYQPLDDGSLRLAWNVEIDRLDEEHYWDATVDAETGRLLSSVDYVRDENAGATGVALAPPTDIPPRSGRNAAARPPEPVKDGSSYRVYRATLESPNDGPRTVRKNPADSLGSPFGWHDTDGAPDAEFTVTRGNNVHAYTDHDDDEAPDPGSSPNGGDRLSFVHPRVFGIDFSQHPHEYAPAAVTNLFYWNNVIHDLTYRYGFTEEAGNFQVDNYGRGGTGGDDVRAEAQDGGGLNNANFFTPPDGDRPRMQMFLWNAPLEGLPNLVTVDEPSSAAGTYGATGANFGPDLDETGVSGDIVLVDDGTGVATDGCEPLVGFPAGSVALIDRGECTFVQKVTNAQAAGATVVIIANNVEGDPITLGGDDPSITIASGMISLADGDTIKAGLPATGTFAANPNLPEPPPMRDGDLDAGVIVHEYGHGVSNRLTGGPSNVSCLDNEEQMGEGWSDFLALSFTPQRSDSGPAPRGIGTYVLYQDGRTSQGIRPTAYSTDTSINPTTYGDIDSLAVPHGVGYAWATMLWEMYWNLVYEHGFNPNPYGDWRTGGNNLAVQLVIDGMKFQPCSPGFVDGRDAILAADEALTGGANQCLIWDAFAKRGLGFSAKQGSSDSTEDGTVAFDTHPDCG